MSLICEALLYVKVRVSSDILGEGEKNVLGL